jgi:hypothetical protein
LKNKKRFARAAYHLNYVPKKQYRARSLIALQRANIWAKDQEKEGSHLPLPKCLNVANRILDIPGEKYMYPFKFNLHLPPPITQAKSCHYPLDADRYYRNKLTYLDVIRPPAILTDINLGISVEEMFINPAAYEIPKDIQSDNLHGNIP